jgi:hypothetical protein
MTTTSIHIRKTSKNPGGNVKVGLNGQIITIPVGADVLVDDDVLPILALRGVDYRLSIVPEVADGNIRITGGGVGGVVAYGLNAVLGKMVTGTDFIASADQTEIIDHSSLLPRVSFGIAGSSVVAIYGTPPSALVGAPYSFTPTVVGGSGTKVFSYSGTSLATYGLAFNAATGAITGSNVTGSASAIVGNIHVFDDSGSSDLPISIAVSTTVALGTLTLSGPLQIGTATSGSIIGASTGSGIGSNIPGITVNSGARTYSGTPTGSAGTIANGLVETLSGATGSPKNSPITVAAAGASFIQPSNLHFIMGPGDSLTAIGGGLAGAYGTTGGISDNAAGSNGTALDGFLGAYIGNRIRSGRIQNMGIGGQTAVSALQWPRSIGSAWTGSLTSGVVNMTAVGGGDPMQIGMNIYIGTIDPAHFAGVLSSFGTGTGGNTGTYNLDTTGAVITSAPAGSAITPAYTTKKTIVQVAANEANIVTLNAGISSSGDPTDLAVMDVVIQALTNPSYGNYPGYGAPLPLAGGLPKTLLIFNLTRRGVTALGASNVPATSPAQLHAYAMALKRYSFDSGDPTYSNPHVIVIDTFDDPLMANLADTTNYTNLAGWTADGVHPAGTTINAIGRIAGARISPIIPLTHDFSNLVDTTTLGGNDVLTQNPCFVTKTGGGNAASGHTVNGTIPSGWQLNSSTSGLTIDISYNDLGGVLGNEIVLHITGTASGNTSLKLIGTAGTTQRPHFDLGTQTMRTSCRSKLVIASGSVYASFVYNFLQGSSAVNSMGSNMGYQGVAAGYANSALYPMWLKNPYASGENSSYITQITKNVDLQGYTTGNPTAINTGYTINFKGGEAVDITLTLSQLCSRIVTD